MKTILKLSLLVLVVSLYSCSQDEINEVNAVEKENNLQLNKAFALLPPKANFLSTENEFQWVAFLAAQAISNDSAAHDAFINSMRVPNKSVSFQNLLDQNAFKEAFENEFEFYQGSFLTCTVEYSFTDYPTRKPEPEGKPIPKKDVESSDEEEDTGGSNGGSGGFGFGSGTTVNLTLAEE